MDQTFMKERKILPLVLSMSLPMVISMAVNSLYNIIDSYFVAKLSEDAMTALALVYPIQNLITAIAVGFGIGINARVAYFLGAQDQKCADEAASQGMLMSFFHGLILTVLSIAGMPLFLRMFTKDTQMIQLALAYANRAFLFSIMITLGVSYEKIFQSVGRMKTSMFSMMCGFVANIILDPLMIFGIGPFPAMGIAGAAYATGIGQTLSLIVYLIFYVVTPLPVKIKVSRMRPRKTILQNLYTIGIPATLNMALASLLISALNSILAAFSSTYVLVLGVYYKLQTFIYLSANGIIQGIRPLVGYNYGAKEYGRVKAIYRTTMKLTIGVMAAGTLLSWIFPQQLIGLFTSNPDTIQIGTVALRIISLGFVVSAISITSSGTLEGLGKGLSSLGIALSRYVVVIIPAAFLFSRFLGASGVWWGFVFAETVTAIFAYLTYRKNCDIMS